MPPDLARAERGYHRGVLAGMAALVFGSFGYHGGSGFYWMLSGMYAGACVALCIAAALAARAQEKEKEGG